MTSFLFEAAVRASVVVLVGLLAVSCLRRRSAAVRHWVLAAAVLGAWATLPLSVAMPAGLQTPVGPSITAAPPSPAAPPPNGRALDANVSDTVTVSEAPGVPAGPHSSWRPARIILFLWAFGSLLTAAALGAGFARLLRIARRAREVDTQLWVATRDELQRNYRLAGPVRVLQSDDPSLLVTWGWWRPTIALPAAARAWPAERVRVVLAHECAHIARGDWAVQVFAEILRALFWFNPLLWLACRRLRDESERACDDAVLTMGIPAASYASHLVELARRLHPARRPPLPALTMARPSGLEGRIVAMLNSSMNRRPASWQSRLVSAVALAAVTLPVAALHAQLSFYTFEGTVRDPSDRVLPDTTLVLANTATSAKYEVRSDAAGRFQFVGLPPATYRLTANRVGFSPLDDTVSIAGPVARDLHLKVGSLEESITVTDRVGPPAPADPAVQQRRAAARLRFEELRARAKAQCAAGGGDAVVGGSLLPPAKLVDVRPVYPEHLKAARVGGIVTMDAVIGTDGLVKEIENVHGPDPALEQAAAEAVRQWQFSSTLLNCQAIDVNMHVTTNFKVER